MMDTSLILNDDLHYQTSYRAGDLTIPGYKPVDLRATLAGMFEGGVDISIFVKNLFDVTYETGPGESSIGAGVISYRSDARLVGKVCVSTFRYQCSPTLYKKTLHTIILNKFFHISL